jgi:hypothetical protein
MTTILRMAEQGRRRRTCHPDRLTPHYDPILSKIVSYSPTSRDMAIRGLELVLDMYQITLEKNGRVLKFDMRIEPPKGVLWCAYIKRNNGNGELAAGLSNEKLNSEVV